MVELVGGGSVINEAYAVLFSSFTTSSHLMCTFMYAMWLKKLFRELRFFIAGKTRAWIFLELNNKETACYWYLEQQVKPRPCI